MVDIRACVVVDGLINPTRVGLTVPDIYIYIRMLRSSLRADLTSKSIGDPKACKAKQDPLDQ